MSKCIELTCFNHSNFEHFDIVLDFDIKISDLVRELRYFYLNRSSLISIFASLFNLSLKSLIRSVCFCWRSPFLIWS